MSRVERRMYKHRRGQVLARRTLLFLSALIVVSGLIARLTGTGGITVQTVTEPTATPVAASFDETVETRELPCEARVWYALQIGVFSTKDAADAKSGLYADRGAPGYVLADGDKYRVLIASYGDKDDAAAVRERLNSQQNVETYLYEWTVPALTLRLSGMAGQLDVVEAGLALFTQTAERLRDGAVAIDQGEMTLEEGLSAVREMEEQVSLWQATAKARFGKPYPALLEAELALADAWGKLRDELLSASDLTALSAGMKSRAMALYEMTALMRAGLQSS